MIDALQALSALPSAATLAYLTIWAVVAVDVFVPPLPSEGTIVAGTALAATGHLNFGLVVLAAILGSCTGDLACYHVGRGWRLRPRLSRGRRSRTPRRWRMMLMSWRRRLHANWRDLLTRRGMVLIIACRFVPAGRTASSFSAGNMRYSRRRFVLASAIAASIWAVPMATIGFLSGQVLPNGMSVAGLLPVAEAVMFGISMTVGLRLWHRLFSSPKQAPAEAVEPAESAEPAA